MHILCICQFYGNPNTSTNGKYYTFFEHLSTSHDITLITALTDFNRPLDASFEWVPEKVQAYTFPLRYANQMSVLQRVVPYLSFMIKATIQAFRVPKTDLLWAVSIPLSVPLIGYFVAKMRKIPWVFEVQDLWPDFPIQMGGIQQKWLQKILYKIEHFLYRKADLVITSSPDMEHHVRQYCNHNRVVTLYHGANAFPFTSEEIETWHSELDAQYQVRGKKVLLYAGTLGRANDIPTALEAFARIGQQQEVICFVVGQGYYHDLVNEYAAKYPFIYHIPPQPSSEIMKWFAIADLSCVTFIDKPILAVNSPAKLMDSLGAGTPVVVTNDGWTKALVEENRCGIYVPASNVEALVAGISSLLQDEKTLLQMKMAAKQTALRLFDRSEIAKKLRELLEKTRER